MKIFLIIFTLVFFVSCKNEVEQKPDHIWSEDKFIDALVEVQITEAYIRLGYNRSKSSFRHKDSLYASTFKDLGINRDDFESNFEYYSARPKLMEGIYEEVIEKLSEKQAELQGEIDQQKN